MHALAMRRLLLAAAVLAALPAGALAAGWEGRTSQGKPIELQVSAGGGLVKLLVVRYVLSCDDGSGQTRGFGLSQKAGDTVTIDADGRFDSAATVAGGLPGKGAGSLTYRVKGRVTGAKAAGWLRIDFALDDGTACTSGRVSYTLRQS
jgi:hypothetical protein